MPRCCNAYQRVVFPGAHVAASEDRRAQDLGCAQQAAGHERCAATGDSAAALPARARGCAQAGAYGVPLR